MFAPERGVEVSVIVTTYERAHILPETIQAILNQTLDAFELIVSDDCSSDETEAVCRSYEERDPRVRYRSNERNLGMPGNLNAAIREARGEFIANLHDGDVFDPTLLEKWLAALRGCEGAAFVFNPCRVMDTHGGEQSLHREALPPCFPGALLLESVFFRRWRFGSPVWGTVMARASAYERVGLFQERFGFCSDVDMWMRLATRYRVAYIDEALISLPAAEDVPRVNPERLWHQERLIERMFWEGRMRHFRGRPWRRALEAGRHCAFVVAARGYHLALAIRRAIRARLNRISRRA